MIQLAGDPYYVFARLLAITGYFSFVRSDARRIQVTVCTYAFEDVNRTVSFLIITEAHAS